MTMPARVTGHCGYRHHAPADFPLTHYWTCPGCHRQIPADPDSPDHPADWDAARSQPYIPPESSFWEWRMSAYGH
jgi:hypothetical protein